ETTSLRRLAARDRIPPRAHARHEPVIALDHVDRLAQAARCAGDANVAGLDALFRGEPHALVPPHARAPGDFFRLPIVEVAAATAPAVFDHEAGRRIGVERGDLVVDVAAERGADAALLAEREIIALPDVVEAVELDHQMVRGVAPGLDE